jgi:uncharacterized membrane protein
MLVADYKQLGDQLRAMQLEGFTEETDQVLEERSDLEIKIKKLVAANKTLVDSFVDVMPPENREVMRQMLVDTETKIREIVLLGLRSALAARELFSDEAELDRFLASKSTH